MVAIGEKFGKLTVEQQIGKRGVYFLWLCKCDCGNYKEVATNLLTSKHTQSCGCLYKQRSNAHKTSHALSKTSLYKCWTAMKQRCCNAQNRYYKNYGERGIEVCDEWLKFENFASWAFSNGYDPKLTLDRIDNDGDYCPENCRWVDRMIQANNRRPCRILEINGESKTIPEWCRTYGVDYDLVNKRICAGWNWTKALLTPKRDPHAKRK